MPTSPRFMFTLAMRLSCALAVSSFLFVPIVLADSHPENHHWPRFLNKKNIWGGASLGENNEENYTAITGTFAVPLVWGASSNNSTGITVTMGLGGLCPNPNTVRFLAGIRVKLIDNVVSYQAGAAWGGPNNQTKWSSINLATGDIFRASVNMNSTTTGFAILENLTNGQVWRENFTGDAICQQRAEWLVASLPDYPQYGAPIPKFSTLSIVNATVKTAIGPSATWLSGGANITNWKMEYNNMTLTNGVAEEDIVVIACEM